MVEPTDGVVTLRPFGPDDVEAVMVADRDPEHRRRFGIPADFVPTREHAQRVIDQWRRDDAQGSAMTFAVRLATSGVLVGGCQIRPLGDGSANLSYWTYPEFRRRGYATRAARLASSIAFTELGVERIEIVAEVDNVPSRHVAGSLGAREVRERDDGILHLLERPRP